MGLTIIVAAGNGDGDASETSPASARLAFTVGAIGPNDSITNNSNIGKGLPEPRLARTRPTWLIH
jgi:subtilisin family serine protease